MSVGHRPMAPTELNYPNDIAVLEIAITARGNLIDLIQPILAFVLPRVDKSSSLIPCVADRDLLEKKGKQQDGQHRQGFPGHFKLDDGLARGNFGGTDTLDENCLNIV